MSDRKHRFEKPRAKPGVELLEGRAKRLSQALIESSLVSWQHLDTIVSSGVSDEHFPDLLRPVWRALLKQRNDGLPYADPVSLHATCKAESDIIGSAVEHFLKSFPAGVDTSGNVEWRARELMKAVADMRLIMALASVQASRAAQDPDGIVEAEALLEEARQRVRELAEVKASWVDEVTAVITDIDAKDRPPLVSSGLSELDTHLGGGFGPGWLVVVMGGAKSGKTAYAVSTVALDLMRSGRRALIISLEMSRKEVIQRLLAAESGVPVRGMRARDLQEFQRGAVQEAADKVGSYQCEVMTGLSTMAAIAGACRGAAQRAKPDLIVIDYLQLVNNGNENRVLDIETTTRGVKLLAQELEVPIMLLSQPNNTDAKGGTIGLYSGKGSGSIAADADAVIVPMRGEDEAAGVDLVG
jgi:replicative DNA helicase